jgi:hypothetical protein
VAAKKLKQIIAQVTTITRYKKEDYVIKQLNHKFVTENAIIVLADKGKTVVIINSKEYSKGTHIYTD